MKIIAIELMFGYVESARISNVVFTNQSGYFESEQEAIDSLAKNLKAIYLDRFDETPIPRKCCLEKNTTFCSDCGRRIATGGFDIEMFAQWLVDISKYSLNDWGYNDEIEDLEITWEPGGNFKDLLEFKEQGFDILSIENAEQVLAKVFDTEESE